MKLRNKKTGKVYNVINESIKLSVGDMSAQHTGYYASLAELNEEWEDYEEPKDVWWLDNEGNVNHASRIDDYCFKKNIQIGNYFETEEEAEKAVEKLKAWKRLKDKGFRFLGYYHRLGETRSKGEIGFEMDDYEGTKQDLDLLFGGEE